MNENKLEKLVEILKPYTLHVEKPNVFCQDNDFLWNWMVEQICVRGGSDSIVRLEKRGDKHNFFTELSLDKMPLSSDEIEKVLNNFEVAHFRPSTSRTIYENYRRNFEDGKFKFAFLFKEVFPKRELSKERIVAERKIRRFLEKQKTFVWITRKAHSDDWRLSFWKYKPISDWLKDIGFAVNLMAFDSNIRKIIKALGLKFTEEIYEKVEDLFIEHVCRELKIFPSQLDKVLYNNSDSLVNSLKNDC